MIFADNTKIFPAAELLHIFIGIVLVITSTADDDECALVPFIRLRLRTCVCSTFCRSLSLAAANTGTAYSKC